MSIPIDPGWQFGQAQELRSGSRRLWHLIARKTDGRYALCATRLDPRTVTDEPADRWPDPVCPGCRARRLEYWLR